MSATSWDQNRPSLAGTSVDTRYALLLATLGRVMTIKGRALLAGDIIRISDKVNAIGQFRIRDLPNFSTSWRLSVLIGPHGDASYLTGEDLDVLFDTKLIVAPSSNRQGIRLDGLPPLKYARSDGGEGGSHASNTIDHGYVVGTLNMNGDTAG